MADNDMELDMELDTDNVFTLEDEDGNKTDFVVVDGLEHNGKNYFMLVKLEDYNSDSDEMEYIVLKAVLDDEGNECYQEIEDEDEFNEVYEIFDERISDSEDIERIEGIEDEE